MGGLSEIESEGRDLTLSEHPGISFIWNDQLNEHVVTPPKGQEREISGLGHRKGGKISESHFNTRYS